MKQKVIATGLASALLLASAGVAFAAGGSGSGGTGGGGGSIGGGGGTPAVVMQVAGAWQGTSHFDPVLSTLRADTPLDRTIGITLAEDVAGNLSGYIILESKIWAFLPPVVQTVAVVGKASSKTLAFNVPVSFYGGKEAYKFSDGGSIACADGSTGRSLVGSFNSKDILGNGQGSVSVDNCPVI